MRNQISIGTLKSSLTQSPHSDHVIDALLRAVRGTATLSNCPKARGGLCQCVCQGKVNNCSLDKYVVISLVCFQLNMLRFNLINTL